MPGMQECQCIHFKRQTRYGDRIRTAYENAVVNVICTLVHDPIRIAVIGSGRLLYECRLLVMYFDSKHYKDNGIKIELNLLDLRYKDDVSSIDALKRYFSTQILDDALTINSYSSYDEFSSAMSSSQGIFDKPHFITGFDTDHATADAIISQWQNLQPDDVSKALIIKWNRKNGKYFYELYSRKGNYGLKKYKFNYSLKKDDKGKIIKLTITDDDLRKLEEVLHNFAANEAKYE